MLSRQEVEEVLLEGVEKARSRHYEAGKRFREVLDDIPSRLPCNDGVLRIHQAGDEYRTAIRDLRKSLVRLHDFLATGVVPEGVAKGWRLL